MCSSGSTTGKRGVSRCACAAAYMATLSSWPPRTVSFVETIAARNGIARLEGTSQPDESRAWHGVQSPGQVPSLPNSSVIA